MLATEETSPNVDQVKRILQHLGKAYLAQRKYDEAREKFEKLLELEPDNPEALLDAAIAQVGLENVTESALSIYQKALQMNPHSTALKIGLATLFMQKNITTQFALKILEEAVALAPANEVQLRAFLKSHFETSGKREDALEHEGALVFKSRNPEAIYEYFEKLWWEGHFGNALELLQNISAIKSVPVEPEKLVALTHAYSLLAKNELAHDPAILSILQSQLEQIRPERSAFDMSNYLLLRARIPDSIPETREAETPHQLEEYELILGDVPLDDLLTSFQPPPKNKPAEIKKFSLQRDFFDILQKPMGWQADSEHFHCSWNGILCANFVSPHGQTAPEKMVQLLGSHLYQIPDSVVRRAGNGVISFAIHPTQQAEAILKLLSHLDDYNEAVPPERQVKLFATLLYSASSEATTDRHFLDMTVRACHLLKYAISSAQANKEPGLFYIQVNEKTIASIVSQPYIRKGPAKIMPGEELAYYEILWRNPLDKINEKNPYRIDRFEIRSCLQKHQGYATYSGFDRQLDRPIITKVLFPHQSVEFLQNPERKAELIDAIKAIGRMNHPGISIMYDMGIHENMIYFVREFIEGKKITEVELQETDRDQQVQAYLQKATRALQYAQQNGVLHLNLRPSNIWIMENDELKITDFGCPAFTANAYQADILFPGQWRYGAPEILSSDSKGDIRSDIYTLGIIAYELLAGTHPYNTKPNIKSPKDIARTTILPLAEHNQPILQGWNAVVMQMIENDPENRFQSLAELDMKLRMLQIEILQANMETAEA